MKRVHLIVIAAIIVFISTNPVKGQTFEKSEAEKRVAGSKLIRLDEKNKSFKYIQLKNDYFSGVSNQTDWLKSSLKFSKNHSLKPLRSETDKKGISHSKYQIFYKNIPIESYVYNVHSKEGRIHSANGDFFQCADISVTPKLKEQEAFDKAILYVNAKSYKWESANSSRPNGELTIYPLDSSYILTYKFDIYAIEPLSRQYIFVNANTGEVVKTVNRIHISNATGTAWTMYNGNVAITTDSYNGTYRLRETGRGGGIETYNLNHSTSYSSATDFTDADNNWTDTIDYNHAANDAHYATEATYDYYYTKFGRNSYDNNGAKITSYVHYSRNYVNAFWDGSCMTYGDGDGINYLPLTPIEVVAHEITHGVTEHSAGLIYSGESGALNESFSDIFGVVIDFFKNPTRANYLMGDAMSVNHIPFRSMQDPNAYGNPDTYKGLYWDPYQEVHTNSGVQNFWFYLVSEGGAGTNDNGDSYSVVGIGREKAAQIAYRTLTVYLTPSSNYSDARFYSIQAATDLFGDCSQEVIAVTNAWCAVGVGDQYNNKVVAGFVTSKDIACSIPATICFYNRSSKASSYRWDFGDGVVDTAKNPTHIFTRSGLFNVKLISEGSTLCNHSDTIQKAITVNLGRSPVPPDCIPHTINPGFGGIYAFQFNTLNKTSNGSVDNYKDFTCSDSTSVIEGRKYKLALKVGSANLENVYIWADLNNNGRFDDLGELIYQKKNVSKTCSDSIIFPGGATYDTPIRLRVATDFANYTLANACSDSKYGQIQDYTLYVRENIAAPYIMFSSNKKNTISGDTVQFKDNSLNLPTSWSWSFHGGSPATSTMQHPRVAYNTPGIYDVVLNASNGHGSNSLTKTGYIKVSTPSPVGLTARIKNPATGDVNLKWYNSDDNANVFEDFEDGVADNFIFSDTCFTVQNGYLKASGAGNNSWKSAIYDRDFQDFVLEYKFQQVQTNYYSIGSFIRASRFMNNSDANGYLINVIPGGSYGVWKLTNGVSTNLIPWKTSTAINTTLGAWNVVTIEAIGDVIKIYVNSQYVDEFTDNTHTVGKINLDCYMGSDYNFDVRWDYVSILATSASLSSLNLPKATNKIIQGGGDFIKSPFTGFLNNSIEAKGVVGNINKVAGVNIFNHYKIYRDSVLLSTTKNTSYVDTLPRYGTYKYFITSLYDDGESEPSNKVVVKWEEPNPGENCQNAQNLANLTSPYSGSTLGYKADFNFCNMGYSPDRIFYIDVPNGYTLNIGQTYNDFDSQYAIRVGGSCPGTTEIACVDEPDVQTHTYLNTSGSLQRVYFILSGYGSNYGNFILAWNLKAPVKPIPNFYANQTNVYVGASVDFTDISAETPTSWKWLFQGGVPSSSTLKNPAVTYNAVGTYDVKLIVSNVAGSDSVSRTGYITVSLPSKPTASFSSSANTITSGASINFYDNSTNSPTSRKWTFAGGAPSVSTLASPYVTYNNPGIYTVKLVVSNAGGVDSIVRTAYITVNPSPKPKADFYSNTVNTTNGANVYFYNSCSNSPTNFKWTFFGGVPSTSTLENVSVQYNTPGVYDVKLVVSNYAGADSVVKVGYITISKLDKPIANFYTDANKIITNSGLYFYSNSANSPTSYRWSFQGGIPATSTYSTPYVSYNAPGSYDVKLVVSNANGADSIIKTGCITVVTPPKPIANFTAPNTTISTGYGVEFSDISKNAPTQWNWTFPGGTPSVSTSSNPNVFYNSPGTYDVKLVVRNAGGVDSVTMLGLIKVYSVLPGESCSNAQDLSQLVCPYTSGTFGYKNDFSICNLTNSPDRIFYIDVPSGDTLRIGQLKNDFDSRHTLRVGGTCPGTTEIACVDDPDDFIHTYINSTGTVQRVYYILGGYGSSVGNFTLYWKLISSVSRQPVANFMADKTSVDKGSSINFFDLSTGVPTSWKWSFPGGTPDQSTYSTPTVSYNQPGTYEVSLIVANSVGVDTVIRTSYITVSSPIKPQANFSAGSTLVKEGTSINFYDNSLYPSSWKWTFSGGNPSTSSLSNPYIEYTTPGLYTVKLVVSNAGGSDSLERVKYITVTDQPKPLANFNASQSKVTVGNYVYFSDNSGNSPSSWKWTFTGGTPSSSTYSNPSVLYNSSGIYNVKLVVANVGGSDSIIKEGYITVTSLSKPVANFNANNTNLTAGNYTYFYDNSTNSPTSWKWVFNGGSPSLSTSSSPGVVYNSPGTYDVKLVVSNAGGSDSITKTSYIVVVPPPKPIASFSASTMKVSSGSSISFYDNSSNSPTARKWTFSGGTPSTSTSNYVSVQYNTPGVYDVKLVVSNSGGSDSIVYFGYITVTNLPKPVANFYTNNNKITTVSGIYFYDNSANSPATWRWMFQGGSPSTSTSNNPYVSYAAPGVYDVKLVVSNASGSDSIIKSGYITVTLPPKPVADFSSNTNIISTGATVSFSDLSTNSPTQWRWTFTGGTPSISTSSNPYVVYNSVGTYDVKLVVKNAGGSDSITKVGMINVVSTLPGENCSNAQDLALLTSPYSSSIVGYKSDFTFCGMGYSPDRVFYIDVPNNVTLSIGQTSNDFDSRHSLRVGGACPGTTEIACLDDPDTQTHTYINTTGVTQRVYYILGVYSLSSSGKFTLAWQFMSPAKPVANFTVDRNVLSSSGYVYFSDQSSGNPTSLRWSFPGGSPSYSVYSNPSVYYSAPGKYDVKLIASNSYGTDSVLKESYITVLEPQKPVVNFTASSTKAMAGSSIGFYDNSTNLPTKWKWTFDGGSPSYSTSSSVSVVYNTPGLYTVKLVASNAGGSDSIERVKYITIAAQSKPLANFYASQTKIYMGSFVYFYDNSGNNPVSWKWTFDGGSPSSSTYSNPSVTYSLPGTYSVKLVVTNAAGSDSIVKNTYIKVSVPPKPVANFNTYNTSITVGSYAYFYDNSTNSPTSWKWTFTGGSPSSSTYSSPSVRYDTPGVYDVKLVVSNAGGRDSLVKYGYITVNLPPKPVPQFYSSSTNVVLGSYVYFYDYSSNSPTSWKWTFSGGSPTNSTLQSPVVQYNTLGTYDVKLVVANSGGKDSLIKSAYITVSLPPKPVANFYASSTSISAGNSTYFYDNSTNNPTARRWIFNGGTPSTSTLSNPYITYNLPGTYSVKLVVSNVWGADSITKTNYITVLPVPKPVANFYSSNTNITIGSYAYFYNSSSNNPTSLKWVFGGGSPSTSTLTNPLVAYNTSGVYDVKLVATNAGGSDSITKVGYINVSRFNYCTSNLGGAGSCPGDISLVSIKGTSLNNSVHNRCNTANSSTYAVYPESGNTTANIESGKTYELSVTTSNSDIISVWIDYNQNGVFESSEWNQVALSSAPNVVNKVNITVPQSAKSGKTTMRIRSRTVGSANGSGDACTNFGSGITEDYTVSLNVIKNFEANRIKFCKGDTVVFTSLYSGGTYNWDFGEGALPRISSYADRVSVIYKTPGLKTVSLVVDSRDTIVRSNYVNVIYPDVYRLNAMASYCYGSTTTINLIGSSVKTNYQLVKDSVNFGSPKVGTGAGIYWPLLTKGSYWIVAKMDSINCIANFPDTLKITEKPIPIAPVISQNNKILTSNYELGNQWYSTEKGVIASAKSKTYEPNVTGDYYAIVSENDCESLPSNTINVIITGTSGIKVNTTLTFYPNPIFDKLYIKSDNEIVINRIEIRNSVGSIVQQEVPGIKRGTLFTIDVTDLTVGYYTIVLFVDKEVVTHKVFKVK